MATIDQYGVCLVSDTNTDNYIFHLDLKCYGDLTFDHYIKIIKMVLAVADGAPILEIHFCSSNTIQRNSIFLMLRRKS